MVALMAPFHTSLAEQPPQLRLDLPKVNLRIPPSGAAARDVTRQMSVAVTLFVAEEWRDSLEWRGGDVRARVFEACAASYFRLRGGDPDGLDLALLREHVAEEIRATLGSRDLAVMFRELAIR